MLRLTVLRLFAQLSSLLVALSLREISVESVGHYAFLVSLFSVISAFLTYEGTFLVISRNVFPSRFFSNLLANRSIWLVLIISSYFFYPVDPIILTCVLGFIISIDSEYLLNALTMSSRVYGKDRIFRKYLSLKVVIAESAVPFLSALSVYFSFANELALIYIFIIFSINFYLIGFAIR